MESSSGTGCKQFVSVVITTLNSEHQIADCLTSVFNTDLPGYEKEIIVVDNGSKDGTIDLISKFPVMLLRESKKGVCNCRNTGIVNSRGNIIVFTDPDCVVSKNWLNFMINSFKDKNTGIVAGGIVPYPGNTFPERYAARKRSHSQEIPLQHPVRPFALTPNLAFRKEVLYEIGLFDARFPGGGWEDADICWRFSKISRLKMIYEPKAIVFHRYRDTYREFFVQHYRYGYGRGLIYLKYRDELEWKWSDTKRTLKDISVSLYHVIRSVIIGYKYSANNVGLSSSYLDFIRNVGQTSGFLAAAFYKNKFERISNG